MPIMGQRVTSVTSSAPASLQATAVSGATTSQRSSSTMTLPRGFACPCATASQPTQLPVSHPGSASLVQPWKPSTATVEPVATTTWSGFTASSA